MTAGEQAYRYTVTDAMACTIGAAVALVHLKSALGYPSTMRGLVAGSSAFLWLAASAAGPFVLLVRRLAGVKAEGPRIGDRLWACIGTPWILGAGLASVEWSIAPFITATGVAMACLAAALDVWRYWVSVSPEEARWAFSGPWTNRLGMVLAIAWPIQIGLMLVAMS